MELTLTVIFVLSGMALAASKKLDTESMMRVKKAYYTNLLQYTDELSTKVYETKEKLEKTIPEESKRRHERMYWRRRFFQQGENRSQNEAEKLNDNYNELISFMHRITLAKSAIQQPREDNLLVDLESINVKLESVKNMLHRFMRKLRTKIVKKLPLVPKVKNDEFPILTTFKDLKISLAFMRVGFSMEGKAQ